MTYDISTTWTIVLIAIVIWDLAWKGMALWKSSRKNQPGWFVALLILNTAGILPIIYLLTHMEHPKHEEDFSHEKAIPVEG